MKMIFEMKLIKSMFCIVHEEDLILLFDVAIASDDIPFVP